MNKIALALILALVAFGCTGPANSANEGKASGDAKPLVLEVKGTAPDFELDNLAGGKLKFEEIKGKVAIVDIWATWCGPCIKEIPMFNKLHEKYDGKGVQMLAITVQSGDIDEVRPYVKEFDMKYPVLMGTDQTETDFGGIIGFPTTFVIGKDGKIYNRFLGSIKDKEQVIENYIEALLAHEGD